MRALLSRRRALSSRLRLLAVVLGPGIIAATADNDATGIYGYALAGAKYQYSTLWILVACTVALIVCQEICARMGAVTGKGLADLIREQYGVKVTLLAMGALLVANFATTIAEFAGILTAARFFMGEEARFVVVPLSAVAIWLMVTKGTYRRVEKLLLAASVIYLLYIVNAVMAHPPWAALARQTFMPVLPKGTPVFEYLFVAVNVIGTTITPWGQFYVQSSVRDKGITRKEYGMTRLDVILGAFFTTGIAFFIMVCCGATLFKAGIHNVADAGQVASALMPIAGPAAGTIFAIGLLNASIFGAITVPLSSAYAVTEALGWESAVGRRTREAPLFIGVFTFLIATSAALVMLFPNNLSTLIILPNIVGATLLPIILVLMLRLVNDRRIMGEYTNSRVFNAVAWTTTGVLALLSLVLVVTGALGIGG